MDPNNGNYETNDNDMTPPNEVAGSFTNRPQQSSSFTVNPYPQVLVETGVGSLQMPQPDISIISRASSITRNHYTSTNNDINNTSPIADPSTPLYPNLNVPTTTQGFDVQVKSNTISNTANGKRIVVKTNEEDGIVWKKIGKRYVSVPPQHDSLFNDIVEFHNARPDENNYIAALQKFGSVDFGDALVKCVYGASFYDFIMKYKEKEEKEEKKFERKRYERLLVNSGIFIEKEEAADGLSVYNKIICPFSILCSEAERCKLKFQINDVASKQAESGINNIMNMITNNAVMGFLGLSTEVDSLSALFKRDKLELFQGGNYSQLGWHVVLESFFTTSKRILLTYYFLTSIKLTEYKGCKTVGIRILLRDGVYTEFYPLHDGPCKVRGTEENLRATLYRTWANLYMVAKKQPLNDVCEYYGEKIAFYFSFLGFYTFMLFFAAGLGLVVFIYGISTFSQNRSLNQQGIFESVASMFDNDVTIVYSFLMSLWATVFLEFFKRYTIKLAYNWDVIGYEKEEVQRPEFKPTAVRISPITGKWERYEPSLRYNTKRIVAALVVLVCVAIVIASVAGFIVLNVVIPPNLAVLPSILSLVVIIILGQLYYGIAIKLTNWENHRTETQYENSFIAKRFLFDFVNFYSSLLYMGIIKRILIDYGWPDRCYPCRGARDDKNCQDLCMVDLTQQLAIIFVGKQIINQIMEIGIPFLLKKYTEYSEKTAKKNKGENDNETKGSLEQIDMAEDIPRHQKDDNLIKFPGMTDDYNEMAIQFGFVMLFVSSFPLGAFFALLNNIFEIRFDAKKLLTEFQRPITFPAANIGTWFKILNIVSYIAVLTNGALIAFTSKYFEKTYLNTTSEADKRVRQILFIHLLFSLKFLLSKLIPDVPQKIAEALQREEYITKVRIEGENPAKDDPEALEIVAKKNGHRV